MKCENCKQFDGYDAINQRIVNCVLYGEITIEELDDEPCNSFEVDQNE